MSSLLNFFKIIADLKGKEGEDFKRLEGEGVPGTLDVGVPHVPVTQKYRFHKMKVKWKVLFWKAYRRDQWLNLKRLQNKSGSPHTVHEEGNRNDSMTSDLWWKRIKISSETLLVCQNC